MLKKLTWFVAVILLGVSLLAGTPSNPKENGNMPASGKDGLIVYYFYSNVRCPSCLKIEAYTRHLLESRFAAELKAGAIIWRPLNVETPGNEHFMDDFKLYTKSVVLVRQDQGRIVHWKNLPRIWELLTDEGAFADYIAGEIDAFDTGER